MIKCKYIHLLLILLVIIIGIIIMWEATFSLSKIKMNFLNKILEDCRPLILLKLLVEGSRKIKLKKLFILIIIITNSIIYSKFLILKPFMTPVIYNLISALIPFILINLLYIIKKAPIILNKSNKWLIILILLMTMELPKINTNEKRYTQKLK